MTQTPAFNFRHWIGLTAATGVASVLFLVLAGIPLMALRRLCGRAGYWAGALLVVSTLALTGLAPAAVIVTVLSFVIALYAELRLAHFAPSRAGVVALLSASAAVAIGFGSWLKAFGREPLDRLKAIVFEYGKQILAANPNIKLDLELVWSQMPAVLVICLASGLALGLIFESRLVNRLNRKIHDDESLRLYEFRNSDIFIWVSILATGGAFLDLQQPVFQIVALNVFYILVFLYFLQGLAVIATFFAVARVSVFWQWLWYFVLIVQLLPLVSLLGFADYWVNFREKILRRRSAESKKSML